MNKVILIGNLTKDPELITTNSSNKVAKFTLAVSRSFTNAEGERETDFINIVVWGNMAENCGKYLSKGRKCAVVGEIRNRSYEAQDGTRRYVTEVLANAVEFLGNRDNSNGELTPIDSEQPLPF